MNPATKKPCKKRKLRQTDEKGNQEKSVLQQHATNNSKEKKATKTETSATKKAVMLADSESESSSSSKLSNSLQKLTVNEMSITKKLQRNQKTFHGNTCIKPKCGKPVALLDNKTVSPAIINAVSKNASPSVGVSPRGAIKIPQRVFTNTNKIGASSQDVVTLDGEIEKRKYEQLMLSLQCPLPNEHQFALEMCMILSAVGEKSPKRLNVIEKVPALLNMLLAHVGFFNDCGLRLLVEETYREAFGEGMDFATFWEKLCRVGTNADKCMQGLGQQQQYYRQRGQLLCECYPGELDGVSTQPKEDGIVRDDNAEETLVVKCCDGCRAKIPPPEESSPQFQISDTSVSLEVDKIGDRVQMVTEILRNFSFDAGNAAVMAKNLTLLRFLLVTVQTEYRSIKQNAFDIISNISKYTCSSSLEGDLEKFKVFSLLKSMIADFVVKTFLSSNDRFKIIRSAEAISGMMTPSGDKTNPPIPIRIDLSFFQRLFQFLTLKEDIILVISCLECLHSATEMGEAACNEIVRVQGFLGTLMAHASNECERTRDKMNVATTSARVTALLIIRNIVKYSGETRRSFKQHESLIANVAMSEDVCSWIAAEILHHLTEDGS